MFSFVTNPKAAGKKCASSLGEQAMAPDTKLRMSRVEELREQEKIITCHHSTTLLFGKRKAKEDKTIQKQTSKKGHACQNNKYTYYNGETLIHLCSCLLTLAFPVLPFNTYRENISPCQ